MGVANTKEGGVPLAVPNSQGKKAGVYRAYTKLSFSKINKQAQAFAEHIEARSEDLSSLLLEYESSEVAHDEIFRTLDLLRNLEENEKYFRLRVGEVTSFLPKNQPLYALTCFVLVPSLMAQEVHFRIPHTMKHFFPKLLETLCINLLFPNVLVSNKTRLEFLRERSALRVNTKTAETLPLTDVVIFTGTSHHASQLRSVFDARTLFISNGAGHNPVVIGPEADIERAVNAVLTLQLYNQGQDCAAPNAILVHKNVFANFLSQLRNSLKKINVGPYRDTNNRVGPISDCRELIRIQNFLVQHQQCIDNATPGTIRSSDAIVEPTIISKPLKEGGNFEEIFAPIIFVQKYTTDDELRLYFEDARYRQNAMYVTLYGKSEYIRKLLEQPKEKLLHDKKSLLFNKHLHEKGVERGTQPYGGRGQGASSLSIHGKITPKATLPQRDIYEKVVSPILRSGTARRKQIQLQQFQSIEKKNVEKILRLTPQKARREDHVESNTTYVDMRSTEHNKEQQYLLLDEKYTYALLPQLNHEYAASLLSAEVKMVRSLVTLINKRSELGIQEFRQALYNLAKSNKKITQLQFFQHIYQLLFGKKHGPKLANFLFEIDLKEVKQLLDV